MLGGEPISLTDGLNFGDPTKPKGAHELIETFKGFKDLADLNDLKDFNDFNDF